MYKSPIELIVSEIATEMVKNQGKQIMRAVQGVGVNVDKKELEKALIHDRQQYNKGYNDAIEKVAYTLAELQMCPCNYSDTDEWLPYVCEFRSECNCSFIECWMQFFKHYDKKDSVLAGDME